MVSHPAYAVTAELDVSVETRDGIELATDVYRPADPETGEPIDEPRPALLDRTPYGKRGRMERHGQWYAKRGYVVAIQDCRGRFDSGGEYYIFVDEPEDGYDTVEWLAGQEYCDGQVGTFGTSYGAWVQTALATQDPPHLEAMFVNQGAANGREATFRHNGAFELRWLCWALTLGGGFAQRALEDTDVQQRLANVDVRAVLENGPVLPGQSPLRHIPDYEEWAFDIMTRGGANDELWQEPGVNFAAYYDEMADVPTVYSGAWYDSYTKATCDNFEALAERKESDHYLLMGPWTHGWNTYPLPSWNKSYSGELEFGEQALRDYQETRLRFFDHYLRGEDTWNDQPPVQYFQMGTGDGSRTRDGRLFHGGEWRSSEEWPLAETERRTYYVHEDGRLSTDEPTVEGSSTTYRFDPRDPVPTIGGNCSSYITYEQRDEPILEYPLSERKMEDITGRGGFDQRTRPDTLGADEPYGPLEERTDVLVYRTQPLEEDLAIAGPIRVRVYGSTDATDTDFTAKLIDEHPPSEEFPNGAAINISDSICRGRFRGYRDEPDFLEPGAIYEFEMEPYPTANVFRAGHRVRLDISSSNYPRYDVNHNTGGPLYGDRESQVATNTVHHDAEYATHVELPVQPR
ncbi:CocE/NonD family hydrolase [Natrarchaeobius halalkaliphilus]|uniref:CocE/NonD family hydrolase n=1 Tax=Natrarchaeobius halalkaliphilus TaxID=1679091 RepID=A0A3N6M9W8_9EURY|nr:CocE/NonD family hydrolase [Natrarchaeobius halalkaliphilus]RQG93110.1 CocE/NonD family hydrolase [Natrarchaeobius halalkaliphilus]